MTNPIDENPADAYGATLLRLALGTVWVSHALLKILVFTLPGTVHFFESIGMPGFMAYVVVTMELAGGAALLAGFCGRQASLLLVPVLLVVVGVHGPNGWVFTSPNGGWEYPLFLLVASLAQWLLGDGAWAARRSNWLVPRRQRTGHTA